VGRDRARKSVAVRPVRHAGGVDRRRSRVRNVIPPTVTPAKLAAYWEEIGAYACVACGAPYEHADHVQPLAKGGEHSVYNLLPLCAPCNLGKSDRDPFEWLTCSMGVDFQRARMF
jgi:5-methylcytosine-specific restriction endonuclease McrA